MPGKPNSPLGQAPWISFITHYTPLPYYIVVLHLLHSRFITVSSLHQVKDRVEKHQCASGGWDCKWVPRLWQNEERIPRQKWSSWYISPFPGAQKYKKHAERKYLILYEKVWESAAFRLLEFQGISQNIHAFSKAMKHEFPSLISSAKRSIRTTRQGRHLRSRPCQYLGLTKVDSVDSVWLYLTLLTMRCFSSCKDVCWAVSMPTSPVSISQHVLSTS
jgi:hypothetical protein